ncbi:exodeoxyribonuclease III [Pseudohongiella sp.]|uniref:Endonuclease/exonuclease/phosphatase domain-containing protein n=1 Tax=marine sediment metagenome TaxID=412755 RepID=A0A0F9Z0Q4_9ZZZZ|nr:exodeoxyribonuclease III [Pseudohongiella sp.]HDZ09912.1 exodeoxyribonuclease III [Pseudohongiella sp.]HEA63658.1 exodeoxyribonuclease III [Pseudohongiella sp.]
MKTGKRFTITTFNCNGVRSAARKGFFQWLESQQPDVVCLQETKAQEHQLQEGPFFPAGYHCHYFDAEKKGYAGVAIYSRRQPDRIIKGMGWDITDKEGRYIQADFGDLSVISLYMPSGSSGEARQAVKLRFLANFMAHLQDLRADGREYVICADWNMCHKEIDLKNWRANRKNPGFSPEERAWLDRLYDEVGFVDAFRLVNQAPDQYSWWSNRGQARANNVGWRLDYHVITPALVPAVRAASIYTDEYFSDHAPVTLEMDRQSCFSKEAGT